MVVEALDVLGAHYRIVNQRQVADCAFAWQADQWCSAHRERVAAELIAWVEETDVDGFNFAYAVTPETFADFVDLVVIYVRKCPFED